MMGLGLPTLTKEGWTDNRSTILEKAYMYWLVSNIQDTNTFYREVESLKYILSVSDHIEKSIVAIKESLERLLDPYFDNVEVITNMEEEGGIVYIGLNVKALYKEEEFNLYKILYTNNQYKIDFEESFFRNMNFIK